MSARKKRPVYAECGCCGWYHRIDYAGDCRDDSERFGIDDLDAKYTPYGYSIEGEDDMGYTHYWTQTRDLTKDEMLDIGAKVRNIIHEAEKQTAEYTDYSGYPAPPKTAKHKIVICGGDGTGSPRITKDVIAFNGEGPNMDHETFAIEPKATDFEFCKTARKPYDVVVVACLTFLATDYGFKVSSDGDHEELQAGVDLCSKALRREYPHPLTVGIMTA